MSQQGLSAVVAALGELVGSIVDFDETKIAESPQGAIGAVDVVDGEIGGHEGCGVGEEAEQQAFVVGAELDAGHWEHLVRGYKDLKDLKTNSTPIGGVLSSGSFPALFPKITFFLSPTTILLTILPKKKKVVLL